MTSDHSNARKLDLSSRLSAHRPGRRRRDRAGRPGSRPGGAGKPANQPPNIPDWTRFLGDGVAVRKYGKPSKHEAARRSAATSRGSRQRRKARSASRRCTSSTASSRRTGCASSVIMPASPRSIPADYRLILHGLVDKPLIFTLDDIKRMPRVNRAVFLRMRGQFRHGMARRAAQRRAVHARHGALRDVYRRAAQDSARRGRRQAERQMAAAGRRRCCRHDALAAAAEGARRCPRRLPDERRDALPGERLSRSHGDARLGSQHVGEVAAADRGRRRSPGITARRRRNTPTCSRTAPPGASPS